MAGASASALIVDPPRNTEAANRSRMYALLAEAFAYPTGETMTRLLDGSLLCELRDVAATLPEPATVPACLMLASAGDTPDDIQIRYTRLFEVCTGRPAVSLLERRHAGRNEPEQKLWEDLLRFYTFFGLDFSQNNVAEPPDHVLIELAFMHYLCFLEAGSQRGPDDLRRGQRDFLSNHLGAWTAHLADALVSQDGTGPYTALAKLLDDVVAIDMRYLRAACRT